MFSAEFGHSTAGQFNILTKSGTNDIHGDAFVFGQNKTMNAYDNLTKAAIPDRVASGLPEKPRYDFARMGGTVGGPVIRDKFFLFGAYQYQTRGREATGVSVLAPTAAGLSTLNSLAANDAVRSYLAQFPVASNATDTVFVNGQAVPVGTFQAFAPDFFNQHDFQVNADYNAGSHQLRGRFLYDRYRAPWINPGLPLSQFTGFNEVDNRKAAFTDVWTISSRWVNDFRLSYSRNVSLWTVPSDFSNFPNVEINTLGLDVGPEANAPQSSIQNAYQALDNVAWTKGAHSLKWGFEYRNWIAPSDFLPRSRGEWSYVDFEQLVNDLVPTGGNGALRGAGTGFFAGNQQAFYTFVQDDWKATPRLTLNLGLRYEYVTNARDAKLQELNSIASVPGLFDFRTPKTDKNNFGPRIGVAWDPTGSGKTSIRAGAGVAYDRAERSPDLLAPRRAFVVRHRAGIPRGWRAPFSQRASNDS
jgi:outer membrane receptor protein involved in Fe transport